MRNLNIKIGEEIMNKYIKPLRKTDCVICRKTSGAILLYMYVLMCLSLFLLYYGMI